MLAAILIFVSNSTAWPYLPGIAGITLLYLFGITKRANWTAIVPGGALLALAITCLEMTGPEPVAPAVAVISGAMLVGSSFTLLAHFIVVPHRAVRVSATAAGLQAFVVAALLAFSTAVPHGVILFCWALLAGALVLVEKLWHRWTERATSRTASLSAIVICCNEADRIERCLSPLADWADEIIVLDSGSTDGTADIARRFTQNVFSTDWQGYGRQKQRALEKCSSEWVLNLDADEYIDASLKQEVDAWLSSRPGYNAFRICWISIVFGKPVFFGADGRYHKRLFRRENARFDQADVHEDIIVDGKVARLASPVIHETFRDYSHLKTKLSRYAMIRADSIKKDRRTDPGPISALVRGLIAFPLLYIRRLGALDGRRGLLMAIVYAIYTFDKYAAAWADAQRRAKPRQKNE